MKLTLEDIRNLCTESSFERGIEYFKMGKVINLEQVGDKITAIVQGEYDYQVTIHKNNNKITADCTCPYDWGGYCKHIIATLITIFMNGEEKIIKKPQKEDKSEVILNSLSLDEIKKFLKKEFNINPVLKENFTIYFSGKSSKERNLLDYKKEINQSFREISDRHGFIKYGMNVDFFEYYDLANRFEKAGNTLEAITIYYALSEVIAENMGNIDDSDGYYGGEFTCAIDNMVDCINKLELDHKEKKKYIQYFFDKYVENDPDYFREYYGYALREICYLEEDLQYWRKLLEPYLPKKIPDSSQWFEYFQAIEWVNMQLHILELLKDKEEFYQLIKSCYHKNHELCLYYAYSLEKDGQNKEAVKVAEEGLALFPPHLTKDILKFLNQYYKKDSPEKYKENLINLFVQDRDWNDYKKLKEICSQEEWKGEIFPIIIERLSKDFLGRNIIVDLYLKEEMFEDALQRVISQESLFTLSFYYKVFAEKNPAIYFKAYQKLIIPFADSRMGRPHYREIVKYLKEMKKIKGFEEEFDNLINFLKTKYTNRPAFLDEMKAV
jgi:hypothetical protein